MSKATASKITLVAPMRTWGKGIAVAAAIAISPTYRKLAL
jgi:hypothetical protein